MAVIIIVVDNKVKRNEEKRVFFLIANLLPIMNILAKTDTESS